MNRLYILSSKYEIFKLENKNNTKNILAFQNKHQAARFVGLYKSISPKKYNVLDMNHDLIINKCETSGTSLTVFDKQYNVTHYNEMNDMMNDMIYVIVYSQEQESEIAFKEHRHAKLYSHMINMLQKSDASYVIPASHKTMIKWCKSEGRRLDIYSI